MVQRAGAHVWEPRVPSLTPMVPIALLSVCPLSPCTSAAFHCGGRAGVWKWRCCPVHPSDLLGSLWLGHILFLSFIFSLRRLGDASHPGQYLRGTRPSSTGDRSRHSMVLDLGLARTRLSLAEGWAMNRNAEC